MRDSVISVMHYYIIGNVLLLCFTYRDLSLTYLSQRDSAR